MLSIRMLGDAQLVARFETLKSGVRKEVTKEVTKQTLLLEAAVKKDKLSGQVLKVRTGRLRASIHSKVESTTTTVMGKVASRDVPYAAIHEFGGKTAPHQIVATKARALAFYGVGKGDALQADLLFRKRVQHPGSKIPERSYMRSTLAERRAYITAALQEAAARGTRA